MQLLFMLDAARGASAARTTAVIPYYSYARSDKKDAARISIAGRLIADLLATAGANRVLTMTLHAAQVHQRGALIGFALIVKRCTNQHIAETIRVDVPCTRHTGAHSGNRLVHFQDRHLVGIDADKCRVCSFGRRRRHNAFDLRR